MMVFLVSVWGLTGCAVLSYANQEYVYEGNAVMVGGDGEPIELVDNPEATNCTYTELMAFIEADPTDMKEYFKFGPIGYVCADFAEEVHNNAEAVGIRAAWVSIDLEENDDGHACNAFETIDKGLVFIDCTGGSYGSRWRLGGQTQVGQEKSLASLPEPVSYDSVAYAETGSEYGVIPISRARSLSYDFYVSYSQNWQEYRRMASDYEAEIAKYNQEIREKVFYKGSRELASIEAWEARIKEKGQMLDELSEQLGNFWSEPLGTVTDITIHW